MSASQRIKGSRVEREIVNLFREAGIPAERVPLSGASRYRGEGHDINIYVFGRDKAPLVFEVKARREGAGFKLLEKWLGKHDGLITRKNHAEPLASIPCRILIKMIIDLLAAKDQITNTRPGLKSERGGATSKRPEPNSARPGEGKERRHVDPATA